MNTNPAATHLLRKLMFVCGLLTLAACGGGGGGGGGAPATDNTGTNTNPGTPGQPADPNAPHIADLTQVGEFYGENVRYWDVHAQATCNNCSNQNIEYFWVVDVNQDGQFTESQPVALSANYSTYNVNFTPASDYIHKGTYFLHNQHTYGKPIRLIARHPETADVSIDLADAPTGTSVSYYPGSDGIFIENRVNQMPTAAQYTNNRRAQEVPLPDFITPEVRRIEPVAPNLNVAYQQDGSVFFLGIIIESNLSKPVKLNIPEEQLEPLRNSNRVHFVTRTQQENEGKRCMVITSNNDQTASLFVIVDNPPSEADSIQPLPLSAELSTAFNGLTGFEELAGETYVAYNNQQATLVRVETSPFKIEKAQVTPELEQALIGVNQIHGTDGGYLALRGDGSYTWLRIGDNSTWGVVPENQRPDDLAGVNKMVKIAQTYLYSTTAYISYGADNPFIFNGDSNISSDESFADSRYIEPLGDNHTGVFYKNDGSLVFHEPLYKNANFKAKTPNNPALQKALVGVVSIQKIGEIRPDSKHEIYVGYKADGSRVFAKAHSVSDAELIAPDEIPDDFVPNYLIRLLN